jgi:hypothetical protein
MNQRKKKDTMDKAAPRTYAGRVREGVRLLDEQNPGWDSRIDLARLDMRQCGNCILGQLYGEYDQGLNKLCLMSASDVFVARYGFTVFPSQVMLKYPFRRLTWAWTKLVGERQAGKQKPVAGL